MHDKVVNIPVAPESVTNTLTMLPKTPEEAGLIEVTFKRKLEYKNSHIRGQLVDPKKLYKVLDHSWEKRLLKMGLREAYLKQHNDNWITGTSLITNQPHPQTPTFLGDICC